MLTNISECYCCKELEGCVESLTSENGVDISTSTRRTNLSIFLVLMLMLMSTQFSLAYTCACAYVSENQVPEATSHDVTYEPVSCHGQLNGRATEM